MGRLSAIWRFANHQYVSVVLLAGLGIAAGYLVFFYVYPHQPKIGVIDIPFTVIKTCQAASRHSPIRLHPPPGEPMAVGKHPSLDGRRII